MEGTQHFAPDDDLGPYLRRVALPPGWRVVYTPVTESTQDLARSAAARGAPDRSVFVADFQTRGRGRRGRAWIAPPGAGLLFSALLWNTGQPPLRFTMAASVAVCEAIERLLGLEPAIKWPNDVLIADRKVAGVLAEGASSGETGYVVLGIGINANFPPEALAQLPPTATALNVQAGQRVHRGELLVLVLERLDAWLEGHRAPQRDSRRVGDPVPSAQLGARTPLEPAGGERLWRAWRDRLWRRGEQVVVVAGGEQLTGMVLDAEPDGTLLLQLPSGETRPVIAGEVLL